MKSLNIRLNSVDAKAILELQSSGLNVSEVARQSIHARAAMLKSTSKQALKHIDKVLSELPAIEGPIPDYRAKGIDLTDRRAVQKYLRDRIAAKQKRIRSA